MIGYPYYQKGYKLLDLETKKIFVSKDVIFKENIFPFLIKKGTGEFLTELRHNLTQNNDDHDDVLLSDFNHVDEHEVLEEAEQEVQIQ